MKQQQEVSNHSFLWHSVLDSAPHLPGVYWFLSANAEVLYVGKAKDLKARLSSYTRWEAIPEKTRLLAQSAQEVKFFVLESELQALLVEAELIRAHQPHFNSLLKDDKSPLYILITKEKFPRVLTARKEVIQKKSAALDVFGPFPSGWQVKQVLKLLRPIFRWCNDRVKKGKPCFFVHIHLCSGACANQISEEEYHEMIQKLRKFLRGKTHELLKEMRTEMKQYSEEKMFEKAAFLRDSIQMIEHVTTAQRILPPDLKLPQLLEKEAEERLVRLRRLLTTNAAIPKTYPLHRIECYDVSNTQGAQPTVSMVVATDGQMDTSEYKIFNIRLGEKPNDYAMLQEALQRRQQHPEWGVPQLVVLDGGKGQLRAGIAAWGWSVPVCSLAKEPDRAFFYNPQSKEVRMHTLQNDDPASTLLRQLRDEAHRFAKKHHTRRRTASVLQ